jgi:superfamily I DNA/RNA helicase
MSEETGTQLNDPQREEVTAINGPVPVIAGEGSGKARVIEFRVRHMAEAGICPAFCIYEGEIRH